MSKEIRVTITPNATINANIIGSGPKGDDGYTPIKGVDYYTKDEIGDTIQQIQNSINYATYVHDQIMASSQWTIGHNLNKFPTVTIVDSSGNVVVGDIEYFDKNNVVLTFKSEFSGKAYLN